MECSYYNLYSFNFDRDQVYHSFDTIVLVKMLLQSQHLDIENIPIGLAITLTQRLLFLMQEMQQRGIITQQKDCRSFWFGFDSINKCVLGA